MRIGRLEEEKRIRREERRGSLERERERERSWEEKDTWRREEAGRPKDSYGNLPFSLFLFFIFIFPINLATPKSMKGKICDNLPGTQYQILDRYTFHYEYRGVTSTIRALRHGNTAAHHWSNRSGDGLRPIMCAPLVFFLFLTLAHYTI